MAGWVLVPGGALEPLESEATKLLMAERGAGRSPCHTERSVFVARGLPGGRNRKSFKRFEPKKKRNSLSPLADLYVQRFQNIYKSHQKVSPRHQFHRKGINTIYSSRGLCTFTCALLSFDPSAFAGSETTACGARGWPFLSCLVFSLSEAATKSFGNPQKPWETSLSA